MAKITTRFFLEFLPKSSLQILCKKYNFSASGNKEKLLSNIVKKLRGDFNQMFSDLSVTDLRIICKFSSWYDEGKNYHLYTTGGKSILINRIKNYYDIALDSKELLEALKPIKKQKVITHAKKKALKKESVIIEKSKDQKKHDEFIAFDLETTGFSPTKNNIIEIAAVKYKNGKLVDKFETLVNPQINIPWYIVRLTGIKNFHVKNQPTITEVMPAFLKFIGNTTLVGHKVSFDKRFLEANLGKKKALSNNFLCTCSLSKKDSPNLDDHKLVTVAKEFLGIDLEDAHRALPDAMVTAEIFLYCTNK